MIDRIVRGDCVEVMQSLPSASFQLAFADPPFNIGKEYLGDSNDALSLQEYKEWVFSWLDECIRLLVPSGVLVVHHIPVHAIWIANYLLDKLVFQNWIAWKANSWPVTSRINGEHYVFLVFSKGKPKYYKWGDMVAHATCRHCGEYLTDWGGKEKQRNPLGKRVSDVWTDIERIRHKSKKFREDANELPEAVLERFIKLYTDENDLVLDPFLGTGTTAAVAKRLNRKFVGIEQSLEYVQIAKKRVGLPFDSIGK